MHIHEVLLLLRIEAEAEAERRYPRKMPRWRSPRRTKRVNAATTTGGRYTLSATNGQRIHIPDDLAARHEKYFGAPGRTWLAVVSNLFVDCMDRWRLRPDGSPAYGGISLVFPVLREDCTPAALKLQPVTDQTKGESVALRSWDGQGAVRLLEHDPASGSMLLERLDANRTLKAVPDDTEALELLSRLLARLTAERAPDGLPQLADIAAAMLDRVPSALPLLADPTERRLLASCAGAVRELIPAAGDRLLHWDLHYDNILSSYPSQQREPWLAIDPKPLAGDPGFELLPALWNRWDDAVATGDVPRAVRRRFDLMTEVLGLDRQRAQGWTLGRVLENALWDLQRFGQTALQPEHRAIAEILDGRS